MTLKGTQGYKRDGLLQELISVRLWLDRICYFYLTEILSVCTIPLKSVLTVFCHRHDECMDEETGMYEIFQ